MKEMIELDITDQNDYCHIIGPFSDGLYCIEFYDARFHIREDRRCIKIIMTREYLDKICKEWLGTSEIKDKLDPIKSS